jgi:hypothetical protein
MQAAVPNRTSFATRRMIRNGQLKAQGSSNWQTSIVTSVATYSVSNARKLTNVTNIEVGPLVEGNGVGREIYVLCKNFGAREIELNAPLFDAEGTLTFSFWRFKYLLDFSKFTQLSKFIMQGIEFQCNSRSSGIMLAPSGSTFELQDCFVSRPKNRGITSIGSGCQGRLIDQCQFLSAEEPLDVDQRVSIALNVNANDVKLRDCRATKFRHFTLLNGQNHLVKGNHFFSR